MATPVKLAKPQICFADQHPSSSRIHTSRSTSGIKPVVLKSQRFNRQIRSSGFKLICASNVNTDQIELTELNLELETRELQTTVRFTAVTKGRKKIIVLEYVKEGSEAEKAGLKSGQQLLSISDPVRYTEMWPLNDRASLRYVRDAIRYRRGDFISLVVSREPVQDLVTVTTISESSVDSDNDAAPMASTLQLIDDLASSGSESDSSFSSEAFNNNRPSTIAEKLEAEYRIANDPAGRPMSDVDKRIARRKERMEIVKERNDLPFFAGLMVAFLAPALAILWAASASGYLDQLVTGSVSRY